MNAIPAPNPSRAGAHTPTLQPAPAQKTTSASRPPSLVARMPQASLLPIPTGLLNLPDDLLRHLIAFLRTENTVPAIRDAARFRVTCERLRQAIPQPIPDGVMGAVELDRLDVLKQLLLDLQRSGKDVAQHLNCEAQPISVSVWNGGPFPQLAVAQYLGNHQTPARKRCRQYYAAQKHLPEMVRLMLLATMPSAPCSDS